MSAWVERFYPLLLGTCVGCVAYYLNSRYGIPDNIKEIFAAVMNVFGVAIGFLATVKTVILGFNEQDIIKKLKKTGSYKKLLNYFLNAVQYSFALLAASTVGLSLNFKTNVVYGITFSWQPYFISIWWFLLATSTLKYYRAIDIFSTILRSLN
jgi:hypothetical protein